MIFDLTLRYKDNIHNIMEIPMLALDYYDYSHIGFSLNLKEVSNNLDDLKTMGIKCSNEEAHKIADWIKANVPQG